MVLLISGSREDLLRPCLFTCRKCGLVVAAEQELVEIMGRPFRATYQNPQGVSCELFTFSEARNLHEADFSTEEYTWFEGYAWRPVGCSECKIHLGWRFEASREETKPRSFFGLLVDQMRESLEGEQ